MAKAIETSNWAPQNEPRGNAHPLDCNPTPPPDPSRSQWLNLVSVEGKSVLWWGDEFQSTLISLRDRGCNQFVFIGSADAIGAIDGVKCVQSANMLPKDSIDIAFVRLGNSLQASHTTEGLDAGIAAICGALKPDGLVLVAIPQELKFVLRRRRTARSVARAGFSHHQYFLEDTLPRFHRAIVPYSENPDWAVRYLTNPSLRDRSSFLGRSKRLIKAIAYRSAGVLNPRYNLLILARKTPSQSVPATASPAERTRNAASRLLGQSSHTPPVVLWSRPYSGKQQLFSYDPRDSSLLVVGQVSSQNQDQGGLGLQSYRCLNLLSPLAGILAEKGVTVPVLLESQESGPMTFCVRSSVSGEDIDGTVQAYLRRDDRSNLTSLIQKVLDLQVLVQNALTENLRDRAARIEDCYFENYLNLPLGDYNLLAQTGASIVQHGDFAPVNILSGGRSGHWGLIDWEWMRSAYPPLYDVFTLFLRVHYIENRQAGIPPRLELMNSVIDSFFSTNWFSLLVRDQVSRYCDRYKIPREDVFSHFIRFLLFQCGRYRYAIAGSLEALAKFEEILKWSIRHRERFVCQ